MIAQIISRLVSFAILLFIPYTIYFNVVHFRSRWKCHKKHHELFFNCCNERNCKWSKYCKNYQHIYTAEEIANIEKLIKELKK